MLQRLLLLHALHGLPFSIDEDILHIDIIELVSIVFPLDGFFQLSLGLLQH